MLKRACFSMKSKWSKMFLHVTAYTLLFALCFGSIVLYTTVHRQQEFLQSALQRSVTLRGMHYLIRVGTSSAGSISSSIPENIAQTFTQDPAVESSNSCLFWGTRLEECTILYEKERQKSREKHHDGQTILVKEDGVMGLFVEDSARSFAFLLNGLELVDGQHFAGTATGNVCLVSQPFAELNGLSVGDTVTATNFTGDGNSPYSIDLTVTGIFTCPESDLLKGIGARAEEMVILPMGFYETIRGKEPLPRYVTVYLKPGEDVNAFVERMKDSLPIEEVYNDHYSTGIYIVPPEKLIGMNFDEILDYANNHPGYNLQIDREWYDMVAEPVEQQAKLAGAMTAMLLGSVVLILVLVTVLAMKERRREIGILLSMGEAKIKIIGQLAVETLIPILLALALGLGLGMTAGVPLVENLCSGVYTEKATDVQKDNEAITYGHLQATTDSYEINERILALDLFNGQAIDVKVYPQAKAQADVGAIAGYTCLLLFVALLAVAGQGVTVMRAKPAQILLGRK